MKRLGGSGGTNDISNRIFVTQYMIDMVEDGWEISPTYDHEPVDRAATLCKAGWWASIINRELGPGWSYKFSCSIAIWAPDGLAIEVPEEYSFQSILDAAKKCFHCGAIGETTRFSFAGRCCKKCLPEMRRLHEYPGWCN